MTVGTGRYKNHTLLVTEPYEGMAVYFVVSNDTDAKLLWGLGRTYDEALVAGRKAIVHEARNEQSSGGRS